MADERPWITTAELQDSNKEGRMLYRSNATGHTFDIDKKGNEDYYEKDRNQEAKQVDYYPKHAMPDVAIVVEPDQPIFMHIPTNRRRGAGQNAELAMSLNGLSVVRAWRYLCFMGFSAQGTRHVTKQDRPVLSALRGGILTVRNTGWEDIDAGDIITYVPDKMLRVDRYGGDFGNEYTTRRKKDNKLFRLVPLPFERAVDYLRKVDAACDHNILGYDINSKTMLRAVKSRKEKRAEAKAREDAKKKKPAAEGEEKEKIASSSSSSSSSLTASFVSSGVAEAVSSSESGAEADPSSAPSSSSSSSSSSGVVGMPCKKASSSKAAEPAADPRRKKRAGPAGPRGGGGGGDDDGKNTTPAYLDRNARKLLLSHFFAGKALHAAEKGALFVLHLFGTQYG